MKRCLVCGCETAGSVGAAGYRWVKICQICKDKEDAAVDKNLKEYSAVIKSFYDKIFEGNTNV